MAVAIAVIIVVEVEFSVNNVIRQQLDKQLFIQVCE